MKENVGYKYLNSWGDSQSIVLLCLNGQLIIQYDEKQDSIVFCKSKLIHPNAVEHCELYTGADLKDLTYFKGVTKLGQKVFTLKYTIIWDFYK